MMLEDSPSKENHEHKLDQSREDVGLTESETDYQFVISTIQKGVDQIEQQPAIEPYLARIKTSRLELVTSLRKILDSLRELHIRAKESPIMRRSMAKGWQALSAFLRSQELEGLSAKEQAVWWLQVQTKLGCSLQFLHSFKQQQDITNSPPEQFPQVWSRITVQQAKNPQKIRKSNQLMQKFLYVAISAVINQSRQNLKLTKFLSFMTSFPRFLVMSDTAKLKSMGYYRKPELATAQYLWNLQENGAIREFNKVTYESIKTNRKIYLPPDGVFNNRTDILTENPNNITVRILYSKKIKVWSEGESLGCCVGQRRQPEQIDTVILHMHGGGFIAMSSRGMQIYTRPWANQLDVPVFSVDYRKPPEHPFPQATLDCLLVYDFLLNHAHKYINVRPKTIVVAGDSAGANLALSLTGLILKRKMPVPKGIYAIYPPTDLRMVFSEGRLNAITDPLLWPSSLLLCLQAYLQDLSKGDDPLASPALLTEEYVGGEAGDRRFPLAWPKTTVIVGTKDPLYDDSLMLMQRMVGSNIDCKCILYDQLSHGFMNTEAVIEEAGRPIRESIDHLRELLAPVPPPSQ